MSGNPKQSKKGSNLMDRFGVLRIILIVVGGILGARIYWNPYGASDFGKMIFGSIVFGVVGLIFAHVLRRRLLSGKYPMLKEWIFPNL